MRNLLSFWQGKQLPDVRPALLRGGPIAFRSGGALPCQSFIRPFYTTMRVLSMPTATALERLAPKFRLAQSGVRIRQTVFGWTTRNFPFGVKTAHALKIREPHVITVTGKAFYDIAHAPADHSNRRRTPQDYAVWEIHPVMKMEVIQ
jgi:hypothetical protein